MKKDDDDDDLLVGENDGTDYGGDILSALATTLFEEAEKDQEEDYVQRVLDRIEQNTDDDNNNNNLCYWWTHLVHGSQKRRKRLEEAGAIVSLPTKH